ncbi:hypothetical protein FSP39_019701 [Pinctada imbricata]|uniref:Trafficking protein particle complex subunit 9 n=1 Tax=Pinctada imbricata TaxID=66713 RepID=A0AA89BRJ9_PINIB|nr:hypothetical protein FSP39_019701 [Pinctada imbricata]
MSSIIDYGQSAGDHQTILLLVRHTGSQLSAKKFTKTWERVKKHTCVSVPGQSRSAWIKYKRFYPAENNEWGDFQAHRKALGLICVGECNSRAQFDELFNSYKKVKEEYAGSLYNSRLIVFGLNRDGTAIEISDGNCAQDGQVKTESEQTGTSICGEEDEKDASEGVGGSEEGMVSSTHSEDSGVTSDASPTESMLDQTPTLQETQKPAKSDENDGGQITFISTKSKRTSKKDVSNSKAETATTSSVKKKAASTSSNSISKDATGAEVAFYPSENDATDLDDKLREFITSIFYVLEGKRLDRSFERQDRMQLLCAPFEKKDYVGLDTDTKSFKKKCQGRLRKHLGDLCLQAGLPGEAILHYQTAMDILRPINDTLWVGGCIEGLCSASVIMTYPRNSSALPGLRRNLSLSTKRGSSMMNEAKLRTGSIKHSFSNGLDDLANSGEGKTALNPDDIIEKYREVLSHYSKFKHAGIIEMEASLKACRVLIVQSKYLQASDFLQNVIYINLRISDEDTINRYCTLSQLYCDIGFHRKAAFFKRIAAMQSVAPQNPKHNWAQCYALLLQALEGYNIALDQGPKIHDEQSGWPVLQARVLNELIFSARKMGNVAVAVRHTTFLLHLLQPYLSVTELREITSTLQQLSSRSEVVSQSLALDNGLILPPVALSNIPYVKSFKLMPLRPHLQPKKLDCSTEKVDTGPFIFTPLLLGQTDSQDNMNKVDFNLVAGDLCEVQLMVVNPMPDELNITQMVLLTEGVEMEGYPANPIIPAQSGPCLVKILGRPKSAGDLALNGYQTHVFGIKSTNKLRDLPALSMKELVVSVTPELPQIQVSTELPKAASFLSGQDSVYVVTSGAAVLYTGQSLECLVKVQNTGLQPLELLNVHVNCNSAEKDDLKEMFTWNHDNICSQLPLQPNGIMGFGLCLYGMGDFLSHTESQDNSEPRCVESLLRLDYSGGPGLQAGYCRRCAINFTVDIHPSVVFLSWESLPSHSCDHCYLMFDLQNVSGQELHLVYNTNQTLIFTPNQVRRYVR